MKMTSNIAKSRFANRFIWVALSLMLASALPACKKAASPPAGVSQRQTQPATQTQEGPDFQPIEAQPPVAVLPVDNAAGEIEVGPDKLMYPPNSGIQAFRRVDNPPPLNDRNQVRVSASYAIKSDRAVFARPLTVTLALDRSKFPPNLDPTKIYPVLTHGGVAERLHTPVKVDLASGRGTYELTRRYPLVSGQTGRPTGGSAIASDEDPELTTLVFDLEEPVPIHASAEPRVLAIPSLKDAATPLGDPIVQKIASVRAKYEAMKYTRAAPIRIVVTNLYKPTDSYAIGQASGGNLILLDFGYLKGGGDVEALLAHEYFHLIQQVYVLNSLKDPDPLARQAPIPDPSRWVVEGTAGALEAEVMAYDSARALTRLKLNFGYRSLFAYDRAKEENHEYQTSVFWHFLRSRHGDLRPVIEDYFSHLLATAQVAASPSRRLDKLGSMNDLDAVLGEELDQILPSYPNPYNVINDVLKSRWQQKSLRRLYLEFLLALYADKDFEPIKTAGTTLLGSPGELRWPSDKFEQVPCPFRIGGAYNEKNSSSAFAGEAMSIIRTIEIPRHIIPDQKPGGYLQVQAACPGRRDGNDVVVVVFPVGSDGKLEKPRFGNLVKPAVIQDWTKYPKALAWLVNAAPTSLAGVQLKAEMKVASDVHISYLPPTDPSRNTTTIVASSDALARLAPTRSHNGVRLTLYRSTNPAGPFERVLFDAEDFVQYDIFQTDEYGPVRENKAFLCDRYYGRGLQKCQPGPFYYQVGQTLLLKGDYGAQPAGAEVRSNILEPGTPTVRLVNSKAPFEHSSRGYSIDMTLSMLENCWQCPGAQFEARLGAWKGYFYSGRMEGKRQFGIVDVINSMGRGDEELHSLGSGVARILLPDRPKAGQKLTLIARGYGVSAERTLELPAHMTQDPGEAKAMEKFKQNTQELTTKWQNDLKKAQADVQEAEKYLQQEEKNNPKNGYGLARARHLLDLQFKVKEIQQVDIPGIPYQAYMNCINERDLLGPQLVIQVLQDHMACIRAEDGLYKERRRAEIELDQRYLAVLDNTDREEVQRHMEQEQAHLARQAKEEKEDPPGEFVYSSMLEPAKRVWDLALVRKGYAVLLSKIQREATKPEYKPEEVRVKLVALVQPLREMAETIAMLTGDRAEAAAIWRLAQQIEMDGATPADREEMAAYQAKEILPAWFPVVDPATVVPADLGTLMKR